VAAGLLEVREEEKDRDGNLVKIKIESTKYEESEHRASSCQMMMKSVVSWACGMME
jgi:hypothetical protein